MKTLEELQAMSHEELVNYAGVLQEEKQKAKENIDYWYSEFQKELSRFVSFKNAVKSVVELIDLPNKI